MRSWFLIPIQKSSTKKKKVNQALQIAVEKIVKNNEFALTIGGDHSIGLGSLAGILSVRPETGVIWVDAHADLNTPFTSETGNMHGMPIGLLMAEDSVRCSIPGFSCLFLFWFS